MKMKARKKYIRGMAIEEDIAEQMENPDFKNAWDDLDSEFELLEPKIFWSAKCGRGWK